MPLPDPRSTSTPRPWTALASLVLVGAIAGCAAPSAAPSSVPASAVPTATPSAQSTPDADSSPDADPIVGTVVRFTSDPTSVDVTIGEDNPTVRDLLSLLPVEITLEEFAGREKIGYFARDLITDGSPGSDPEDGDLIYYTPWGNIGFYYDAEGIDYSEATVHLGTYTATEEQLSLLEGGPVTIEIIG